MVHLIDKSALVAEIERQKIGYNVDGKHSVEYNTTRKILNIINSLEVKEVDLEKEIDKAWNNTSDVFYIAAWEEFESICKYFFELGLKVQKGE